MNKQISISVIIPHYNIPDLLIRALRSIPQREDVQVIIVDDGSDVNIGKIVEQIKNEDCILRSFRENIEFYPQPHCGLAGMMRNIGVEHAKGEWLTFLDADDFFTDEADNIFTEVLQFDEDIVFYNSKAVMSDDISIESGRSVYSGIFDIRDEKEKDMFFRYTFHSLWGKFIKKELVDNYKIRFDNTPYGNDVYFAISCGVYAESIRVCKDVLYTITERSGSITTETQRAKEKRLRECKVRYDVAYRTHSLLRKNKVKMPVEYDPLVNALGLFRSEYKKEYYKRLLKMILYYPSGAWHFIKKDFNYIFLGVRNPSSK